MIENKLMQEISRFQKTSRFTVDEYMLPVLNLPSVLPRNEGPFEEIENFSGTQKRDLIFDRNNVAVSGISTMAAPHTPTTVGKQTLIDAMKQATGKLDSRLPFEIENVDRLPASLITWFCLQNKETEEYAPCDLLNISCLEPDDQEIVCSLWADETQKAVQALQGALDVTYYGSGLAGENIIIYGNFGHVPQEVRAETNTPRGAQSAAHGHTLISVGWRDDILREIELTEVTHREILKQISPFDAIIFQEFGTDIQEGLLKVIQETMQNNDVTLSMHSMKNRRSDNKANTSYNEWRWTYDKPVALWKDYYLKSKIAYTFNNFYAYLIAANENWYKSGNNTTAREQIINGIRDYAVDIGFSTDSSRKLGEFVTGIKPTYMQLRKWREELDTTHSLREEIDYMYQKAERHQNMYKESDSHTDRELLRTFLRERNLDPSVQQSEFTFPMRLSGSYYIGDYYFDRNNNLMVISTTMTTGFAGRATAENKMVHGVLRREESNR